MNTIEHVRRIATSLLVVCIAVGGVFMSAPAQATETMMTVNVIPEIGAPLIVPPAGMYPSERVISITSKNADYIRYTTDGTEPTCETGKLYGKAFIAYASVVVKAIGCNNTFGSSRATTSNYMIGMEGDNDADDIGLMYHDTDDMARINPRAITSDEDLGLFLDHVEQLGNGMVRVFVRMNVDPMSVLGCAVSTDWYFMNANMAKHEPIVSIDIPMRPDPVTVYARHYTLTGEPASLVGVVVSLATGSVVTPSNNLAPSLIVDPADHEALLTSLYLARKSPEEEDRALLQVMTDAKEFGLTLSETEAHAIRDFVVYGISLSTIKVGQGERRAIARDYMDTVHRSSFVWTDIERMTNGLIPIVRSLERERRQAIVALPVFHRIFGHDPDFQNSTENLAWNTLMYRIRFHRDLGSEKRGINAYQAIYGHAPKTSFSWSVVRVLGYVK